MAVRLRVLKCYVWSTLHEKVGGSRTLVSKNNVENTHDR